MAQSPHSQLLTDTHVDLPFRVEKGGIADRGEVVVAAASLGPALSAYFTAVRESPGHSLALREGDRVLASSDDQTAICFVSRKEQVGKAPRLTNRDREVLRLLITGLSMKQVAARLGISPRTVAFHKYKVMEDNQLHSNADLFRFILGRGLLVPE